MLLPDSPEKPETVPKTLKISRRDEDFKLEALVKKPSAAPGFPKIIIRDRPREDPDTAHDAGELIGMAQAAALLEVSEATVRNWVKLGRIVPAGQAGRKNVFRKKDILDLRDDIAGDAADSSLKRRRNKTRTSGSGTYCSYITKNRTNLAAVDAITAAISCCASVFPLEKGRILLADAAVKMLHARGLSGCPDLLIFPGHRSQSPVQLTGQYVEDTLYLTNGLLDGSLQGEPASMPWNNGEMKYAKIGRGQMVSYCYNPENL